MFSALFRNNPRLEAVATALDQRRLKLPMVNPLALFEQFDRQAVTLTELPSGPWSSPIADAVTLAKIAMCIEPPRVLEVGSYRGHTTRLLAEHTPADSIIVALDRDPRHGDAYRGTTAAAKIERRVGDVGPAALSTDSPGTYDLIFLDADHSYRATKHDTEILLPFLKSSGLFVWHDYANWGRFSKKNGVPEFLHELARSLPIAALGGSWLAAYSPTWTSGDGAKRLSMSREDATRDLPGEDPWETGSLRG